MNICQYLDATYLKTAKQSGLSDDEVFLKIDALVSEAIEYSFKAVMLRPPYVKFAKTQLLKKQSNVLVGTVIGFHEGTATLEEKLSEAQRAIADGADELDIVINYPAFIENNIALIKKEVKVLSELAIENNKTIKWIIEVAALTDIEIKNICLLISQEVIEQFKTENSKNVFIKSSTGFYNTLDGQPNGATQKSIALMLKYSVPLPVKASGGIKSYNDAVKMINLGVLRIGTSSAKAIADDNQTKNSY